MSLTAWASHGILVYGYYSSLSLCLALRVGLLLGLLVPSSQSFLTGFVVLCPFAFGIP